MRQPGRDVVTVLALILAGGGSCLLAAAERKDAGPGEKQAGPAAAGRDALCPSVMPA